jgi:hypothetical protein
MPQQQKPPIFKYLNGPRHGLTHKQREERRREISLFHSCNPDISLEQIAQAFNVGTATVNVAIKQFEPDVQPQLKQQQFEWSDKEQTLLQPEQQLSFAWYSCSKLPDTSLAIVNDLLDPHVKEVDLSRKYNLSRQRINQIKQKAISKGVVFPDRHKEPKICVVCGTKHNKYTKTCSKECLSKLYRQIWSDKADKGDPKWSRLVHHVYECLGCGSRFERSNYMVAIAQASGVSNPKYCSRDCYHLYGNGLASTKNQPKHTQPVDKSTPTSVCQICHSPMDQANNIGICKTCLDNYE